MSLRKFVRREYQGLAIDHLGDNPRSALFAKPGMGKTSSTLALLDSLYLAGESTPTIILAPLRVARYTWPAEAQKWEDFKGYEISPIVGNEKQRLAAMKKDVPIYTTNYEQIPWLAAQWGSRWPYGIIISDESTKLKNARISVRTSSKGKVWIQAEKGGSNRASLLAKIAFLRSVKRFHELTGTPASNGLKDLWGQIFFLDGGHRLGNCYGAFEQRYFMRVMRHRNDKHGELVPRPYAEEEINRKIADICLALDPKDWFPNLREPVCFTVTVDMPAKARDLYRKMERDLYIEIEQKGIEAFTASAMMMKCRQLAAGAVYTNPDNLDEFAEVHDEKIQALESIYAECGGMPILVATNFTSDMARLLKAFPKGVDLSTDAGLRAFMSGEAEFGFGHPASIGHGYDGMQDITNVIVFFSSDFNLEFREQIIERIGPTRQLQSGHDRNVLIYDIVAEDTIDEDVQFRLRNKCSVQDALFARLKKKPFA